MTILCFTALSAIGCGTPQVYLPPERVGRYQVARAQAREAAGRLSVRDLDGDGVPELVLYRKPALEILRVDRAARRVSRWRRQTLDRVPFYRQWHSRRLLLFSREGVAEYDPAGDRLTRAIETELTPFEPGADTVLSGAGGLPSSGTPLLAGDADELLLPVDPPAWRIYRRQPDDRWRLQDRIEVPGLAPKKTLALPVRSRTDLDGDGRADLVLHGERKTWFYYRGTDGKLPRRPSFVLRHPREKGKRGTSHTRLADLNADGFADLLLVTSPVGEPGSLAIYLGHPRRRVWSRPDQRLAIPGFFRLGPLLSDRNRDGQLDLTFISVEKPGVLGTAFNLVFRSRFVLSVELLHYRGVEGGYPEDPSETEEIDIAVDIDKLKQHGRALKNRVAHLGDLDRDGLPDVALLSEDRKQLELYYNFRNLSAARKGSTFGRALDAARDLLAGLQNLGARRPDLVVGLPGGPYEKASVEPVRFDQALTHPDLLVQARTRSGKTRLFVLWSEK